MFRLNSFTLQCFRVNDAFHIFCILSFDDVTAYLTEMFLLLVHGQKAQLCWSSKEHFYFLFRTEVASRSCNILNVGLLAKVAILMTVLHLL